jgi:hypothetical protein
LAPIAQPSTDFFLGPYPTAWLPPKAFESYRRAMEGPLLMVNTCTELVLLGINYQKAVARIMLGGSSRC